MANPLEKWSPEKSAELYAVRDWGAGFFDISSKGEVLVSARTENDELTTVSLMDIADGIRARGLQLPAVLRITNLLHERIRSLHETFRKAIQKTGYKGDYRGVYPIKVNQQEAIVDEISTYGKNFHHGLEAGSKAELIAAIGLLKDPDACLVCNGYKDEEFIDLGLYATLMGIKCIFVVEMPSEVDVIIERSRALKIKPNIGIRIKLSTRASGQWAESGGDRSVFGLTTAELLRVIDHIREEGMLDCVKLLHYHIGSQIPNIRDIRAGVQEACRVYRGLVEEGAPMGFLDLGGGLAVDYDGSHTNFASSRNYSLDEYCTDIVEAILSALNGTEIPHPTIITESGRATVAYSSILLFSILDVSKFDPPPIEPLGENPPEALSNLLYTYKNITIRNAQESYNDALYYRDELGQHFRTGRASLRQRATGDVIFWHTIKKIDNLVKKMKHVPEEFENFDVITSDIYYCNFSLFQSLPDVWAIDQLFPIMPIHRLKEAPTREAILSDITCDCDGKIDKFIDLRDVRRTLPLHEFDSNSSKEYILGAFLVGAYQETLGDLHNLLGDTNVVTVKLVSNNTFVFEEELEGDTVSDVLSYVEYDPKELLSKFRKKAESAVRTGTISPSQRRAIVDAYANGLRGYTYFER